MVMVLLLLLLLLLLFLLFLLILLILVCVITRCSACDELFPFIFAKEKQVARKGASSSSINMSITSNNLSSRNGPHRES